MKNTVLMVLILAVGILGIGIIGLSEQLSESKDALAKEQRAHELTSAKLDYYKWRNSTSLGHRIGSGEYEGPYNPSTGGLR